MNQDIAVFAVTAFTLLTGAWLTGLVIDAAHRLNVGVDQRGGVQQMHRHRVARLGGVAIFAAMLAGLLLVAWAARAHKPATAYLIVCLLPVFGIGLLEDLTGRVGAGARLLVAMLAGAVGWWLFGGGLSRIGWAPADAFLATHAWAALAMTVMAAAGSAHSVNIIDGCNGLSGFFIMAALAALATVAATVGNVFVFQSALVALAAVGGFFVWNFPHGRIFLGDSGAYMMGFLIAQLGMLLMRHSNVSPWCVMLIMAYPAWETLFSMYRRSRHGFRQLGQPDARHLHHLIYRRILKWAPRSAGQEVRDFRSAFTAMMIWPLILLCMVPAAMFWQRSLPLFWLCLLFAGTYTAIYLSIVRFRTPRLLTRFVAQRKRRAEVVPAPALAAAATEPAARPAAR